MVKSPLNTKTTIADTNMSLFEQFEELKAKSDAAERELDSFLSNNKKQLLKDVAAQLKAIPGMSKLVIYGYTPGFNDGDACTHSSYSWYTDRGFREFAEYDEWSYLSFMGVPDEIAESGEAYDWDGFDGVNTYSDEDTPTVNRLVNILEYLIDEIYYTDYMVMFDFSTEETTIKHEDYDCGH